VKIFSVTSVSVVKVNNDPLTLHIHALGRVSSTGWTHLRLEHAAPRVGDPVLDFSFEGDPPHGMAGAVMLPATASYSLETKSAVDAIVVSSRTNSVVVHASEFVSHTALSATSPQALQASAGQLTGSPLIGQGHIPQGPVTTFIVGEEGPTWLFIEHHPTLVGLEHTAPAGHTESYTILHPAENGLINPTWPTGPGPLQNQGGPMGSF